MITPQQLRIIAALSQGSSIAQAAEAENIHRNTITNWRRSNPAFATELDSARTEQRQYWQDQATRLDCLTNPNS